MNFLLIRSCIDVDQMQRSKVVLIGAGGSVGLACNLARSGVRVFHIYDFDIVTEENIPRQGHSFTAIGTKKTESLATEILRINPDSIVRCYNRDVTTMTDDEQAAVFSSAHLLIDAADSFKAQSFGNEIALKFKVPAIWIGLYAGGGAGEIIFWDRDILPCYRCLCAKRNFAQEQAVAERRSLDPSSQGCTINDITLVDAIAGGIATGLLTRGADNRLGRLIYQLNGRNFIQVQLESPRLPDQVLHCSQQSTVNAVVRNASRAMQLALIQLPDAPDFRRAASFAVQDHGVPAAFRQRQYRRFRSMMVSRFASLLQSGISAEELMPGLTQLVSALGMAAFEADYVRVDAQSHIIPQTPPRPDLTGSFETHSLPIVVQSKRSIVFKISTAEKLGKSKGAESLTNKGATQWKRTIASMDATITRSTTRRSRMERSRFSFRRTRQICMVVLSTRAIFTRPVKSVLRIDMSQERWIRRGQLEYCGWNPTVNLCGMTCF